MKVHILATTTIHLHLDDVKDLDDAIEQVKSICRDDPSILDAAIEESRTGNHIKMFEGK